MTTLHHLTPSYNKSGSVKARKKNVQFLAVEIYKALNNMSTSFMPEPFLN